MYNTCFPSSFTAGLAEISSWAKARAISLILPVTIYFFRFSRCSSCQTFGLQNSYFLNFHLCWDSKTDRQVIMWYRQGTFWLPNFNSKYTRETFFYPCNLWPLLIHSLYTYLLAYTRVKSWATKKLKNNALNASN